MESKFDGKQIWKSGSQNVPNLVLFPLIAYKSHWWNIDKISNHC